MSDLLTVCEKMQSEISSRCVCVENIRIRNLNSSMFSNRANLVLPAVLINESAIIVFVQIDSSEDGSEQLRAQFRNVLNALIEQTDLSMNAFMLCGIANAQEEDTPSALYTFNIYNDRINYFTGEDGLENFVSTVVGDLLYRRPVFDEEAVSNLAFKFELMGGSNGEIRIDSEGNRYVKKRGQWLLASDIDPDDYFQKTALFGVFGAHKFAENKKSTGILYFLTCGFFGVGWLFDCFSIIAGIYRDSEGRYLIPIANRKLCLLKMLGGLAISLIYIALYLFVFRTAGNFLNSLLDGAVVEGAENIQDLVE